MWLHSHQIRRCGDKRRVVWESLISGPYTPSECTEINVLVPSKVDSDSTFRCKSLLFYFGIPCCPHRRSLNALPTFKWMGGLAFTLKHLTLCEWRVCTNCNKCLSPETLAAYYFTIHSYIFWIPTDGVGTLCQLTARSCLTNMSDAFSEMFPTNTVVVGPPLSSVSLALMVGSFFGSIGLCATATAVGRRTCEIELHFRYSSVFIVALDKSNNKRNNGKMQIYKNLIMSVRVS